MKKTLAVCLSLLLAQVVFAQNKPEEFINSKWEQLSKDQILELIKRNKQADATFDISLITNVSLKLKENGEISGYASNARGTTGMTGTWRVEEDGKLCLTTFIVRTSQKVEGCFLAYTLDGKTKISPIDGNLQKSGDLAPSL